MLADCECETSDPNTLSETFTLASLQHDNDGCYQIHLAVDLVGASLRTLILEMVLPVAHFQTLTV